MPGARGAIHVVDPSNCTQVSTISSYEIPEDPTIRQQLLTSVFQAGVPAADSAGNVYYAVWARPGNPLALLSHFVKVTADGTVSSADYPALTSDPDQRPALNAAAAIDTNGTIYAISRGNNPIGGASNGWVLALDQGLNLLWMGSLRSDVTHIAQVNDNSSSTPVIGFDGRVFYGGWNSNGRSRGYLYSFSPSGDFLGYFDFGWDTTPGVYPNPNYPDSGPMYYLVEKDNHYSIPPPDGPYYMSSINPDTMSLECQYELVGREWCVNSVAIDRNGIVYGDGEDGFIYRIEGLFPDAAGMCNVSATRLFARQARDAAYTPTAMHPQTGKIITVNDRYLFVVGN